MNKTIVEKGKRMFVLTPEELQVTNNLENGSPEYEMIVLSGRDETFLEFYMRGSKGVLISDTSIYLIDEELEVTGYSTANNWGER